MTTTVTIEHEGPAEKMLNVRQFTRGGDDGVEPDQIGDPQVLEHGAKVTLHVHEGNFLFIEEATNIVDIKTIVAPMVEFLSFGDVLKGLIHGNRYARSGWNGANQFIQGQFPDEHSKMNRPYIYISPVDGMLVPWLASMTDMLANDWLVVPAPDALDRFRDVIEAEATP